MKEKHKFNVLSDKECESFWASTLYSCKKRIKQNLIDKQPSASLCYNCDRAKQKLSGNEISTASEVKMGKRIGRKKGIYSILG